MSSYSQEFRNCLSLPELRGALAGQSPCWVVTASDGRVVYANAAAAKAFGFGTIGDLLAAPPTGMAGERSGGRFSASVLRAGVAQLRIYRGAKSIALVAKVSRLSLADGQAVFVLETAAGRRKEPFRADTLLPLLGSIVPFETVAAGDVEAAPDDSLMIPLPDGSALSVSGHPAVGEDAPTEAAVAPADVPTDGNEAATEDPIEAPAPHEETEHAEVLPVSEACEQPASIGTESALEPNPGVAGATAVAAAGGLAASTAHVDDSNQHEADLAADTASEPSEPSEYEVMLHPTTKDPVANTDASDDIAPADQQARGSQSEFKPTVETDARGPVDDGGDRSPLDTDEAATAETDTVVADASDSLLDANVTNDAPSSRTVRVADAAVAVVAHSVTDASEPDQTAAADATTGTPETLEDHAAEAEPAFGAAAPLVESAPPVESADVTEPHSDVPEETTPDEAGDSDDQARHAFIEPCGKIADGNNLGGQNTNETLDQGEPALASLSGASDEQAAENPTVVEDIQPTDTAPSLATGFVFQKRVIPDRFAWQATADGEVSVVSEELARAVGPEASAITGKSLPGVLSGLGCTNERPGQAIGAGRAFSGVKVDWSVDGSSVKVPVDLSGSPMFDKNGEVIGYRGFGAAHTYDAIVPKSKPSSTDSAETGMLPADQSPDDHPDGSLKGFQSGLISAASVLAGVAVPRFGKGRTKLEGDNDQIPPESSRQGSMEDSTAGPADGSPSLADNLGDTTATPDDNPSEAEQPQDAQHFSDPSEDTGPTDNVGADEPDQLSDEELVASTDEIEDLKRPDDATGPQADPGDDTDAAVSQAEHEAPDQSNEQPVELEPDPIEARPPPSDQTRASKAAAAAAASLAAAIAAHKMIGKPGLELSEARQTERAPDATASAEPAAPVTSGITAVPNPASDPDTPLEDSRSDPQKWEEDHVAAATGESVTVAVGDPMESPTTSRSHLTKPEQDAFRQIARELGARFEGDLEPQADLHVADDGQLDFIEPPVPVPSLRGRPFRIDGPDDTLSRLLDRLPVGMVISKSDELVLANQAFLKLTGYQSVEELHLKGGMSALFADDDLVDTELTTLRGRVGPDTGHMRIVHRDGIEIPIDVRLNSIPWQEGSALLMSFTAPTASPGDDCILDPRSELRRQINELEAILDTATDGVLILSVDGTIISANKSAQALFGCDDKKMKTRKITSFLATESHQDAIKYLARFWSNGVASILNDGLEVVGETASGDTLPIFMTLGRLSDQQPPKLCAVLRDVTQWKAAEEQLRDATLAAETANSQKSDFLARISHEIRTPLNAIIGFSEVMLDERLTSISEERRREYLDDIHASGTHIMSLVNDLLDLARIEAGRMDLNFEVVSIAPIVRECVTMIQAQAIRDKIILRTSVSDTLPNVVADQKTLKQILLNLLSNAVKFNVPGGQVIVSALHDDMGDLLLCVKDTGIGIDKKDIPLALEPFRRLSSFGQSTGSGLGLPLTKALVEANQATFTIRSELNLGTVAEVRFPPVRVLAE